MDFKVTLFPRNIQVISLDWLRCVPMDSGWFSSLSNEKRSSVMEVPVEMLCYQPSTLVSSLPPPDSASLH